VVDTNFGVTSLFKTPLMEVELSLDTDKLTEFVFDMWNKDKDGKEKSNRGGWHSNNEIHKHPYEELQKLKKEITHYLRKYHLEVFRDMIFTSEMTQVIDEMWANINEKHDYNEWHVHPYSNLSGAYYVKHDGSKENGDILFKHPDPFYAKGYGMLHWPPQSVEAYNEVSAPIVEVTPKTNLLLLFPSWLEHKVNNNLKNDTRISFSFNTTLLKIN
tara:strand:+ start:52 stop:696 length:645 start_codon:yes stop_codon:yes gene_type:complete